jgi:L-2-hydroxyglutarate oxidase LhgO
MEVAQTVVIGAGVVGLATAVALARRGRSVLIVEREHAIGTGVSSRSSEVVHAGIYYPQSSMKAQVCVRGNALLYAYCASRGVDIAQTGKLVVATSPDQRSCALPELLARGEANGVPGLRLISSGDALALEPQLECQGALMSPSSGIVDSHALMLALLGDAERAGATLALGACVLRGERAPSGRLVVELAVRARGQACASTASPLRLECEEVINCAGLGAVRLGRELGDRATGACLQLRPAFARGSYFALAPGVRSPFSRLIYPSPQADLAGLGVHATVDLAGRVRFGPDVEWLAEGSAHPDDDASAYSVDAARARAFYAAIRRYWPGLPDDALVPDYAGIRPKLSAAGEPAADFLIARDGADRPGLWHVAGVESPGLTSCLALADKVADKVTDGAAASRAWTG